MRILITPSFERIAKKLISSKKLCSMKQCVPLLLTLKLEKKRSVILLVSGFTNLPYPINRFGWFIGFLIKIPSSYSLWDRTKIFTMIWSDWSLEPSSFPRVVVPPAGGSCVRQWFAVKSNRGARPHRECSSFLEGSVAVWRTTQTEVARSSGYCARIKVLDFALSYWTI